MAIIAGDYDKVVEAGTRITPVGVKGRVISAIDTFTLPSGLNPTQATLSNGELTNRGAATLLVSNFLTLPKDSLFTGFKFSTWGQGGTIGIFFFIEEKPGQLVRFYSTNSTARNLTHLVPLSRYDNNIVGKFNQGRPRQIYVGFDGALTGSALSADLNFLFELEFVQMG